MEKGKVMNSSKQDIFLSAKLGVVDKEKKKANPFSVQPASTYSKCAHYLVSGNVFLLL